MFVNPISAVTREKSFLCILTAIPTQKYSLKNTRAKINEKETEKKFSFHQIFAVKLNGKLWKIAATCAELCG